jgi:hypothetical protein
MSTHSVDETQSVNGILPREWVRGPQWKSDEARAAWEPVLNRAVDAWAQIELASVTSGLRSSALVQLTRDELPIAAEDCARVGLELSVIADEGIEFRCAVHKPGLALSWHKVWKEQDHERIAEVLRFPGCCAEFFMNKWIGEDSRDVTRFMPTIEGPWESNIMLRWLGVRLVPHLPCSGDCEKTINQARRFLKIGEECGADVTALERLLRLPVQYNAHNGLAIVETPYFRFAVSSDPVSFAAERAAQLAEPTSHEDNGFSTRRSMEDAHSVVMQAVGAVNSAIDLGCGDGALLAAIRNASKLRLCDCWRGIECDPERASRGRQRHRHIMIDEGSIETVIQNINDGPFDVALLMPGRLIEAGMSAAMIRDRISKLARKLVVYAYGDWIERFNGLVSLAREAGFEELSTVYSGAGVQAAEVKA